MQTQLLLFLVLIAAVAAEVSFVVYDGENCRGSVIDQGVADREGTLVNVHAYVCLQAECYEDGSFQLNVTDADCSTPIDVFSHKANGACVNDWSFSDFSVEVFCRNFERGRRDGWGDDDDGGYGATTSTTGMPPPPPRPTEHHPRHHGEGRDHDGGDGDNDWRDYLTTSSATGMPHHPTTPTPSPTHHPTTPTPSPTHPVHPTTPTPTTRRPPTTHTPFPTWPIPTSSIRTTTTTTRSTTTTVTTTENSRSRRPS